MIRIGIEAQRLFRRKKHGMEIVALELIRQLQQLDKENQYFIFVKDDEDRDCISETENFKIVSLPGITYMDWEQVQLPKAVRKYRLDVLHCTCNTAPLKLDVPLVLTLHDIIYLESISFSGTAYQNFGNLYRRWVVPRVLEKCGKVITVSYYEQERIKQLLNLDDQLVEVVYNGISHDFRLIEERDLAFYREKYHLPAEFILYFANPAPKKNAFNTLSAYKFYADHTENPLPLVLADTNQTYISRLLEKIKAEHLSSYITVLKFIPFNELPFVYNLASLFLYPSKRESFGLPVVEAMACGTPVITSDTSSMPEVAKGAALLADPLDITSIANQLIAYSSNKDSYEPLITKGLKRAKDFTWQHAAKKVLQIYHQLHEENELSATRNDRKTHA